VVNMYDTRIAICKECPSYEKITSMCKECGCFMFLKARFDDVYCPLGKWKRKKKNMAHFAQLDFNNIVMQIIVVDDTVLGDATYPSTEQIGITFLQSLFGEHTKWKQTSSTGEFRRMYAFVGGIYREDLDVFVRPQPYNSWVYNVVTNNWDCPIPYPGDDTQSYAWEENGAFWKPTESKAV
jgi:hypothetical protein